MQSNTPIPPQRNRRAGRTSPLPATGAPTQDAPAAPQAPAAPVQPTPAPGYSTSPAAGDGLQPLHGSQPIFYGSGYRTPPAPPQPVARGNTPAAPAPVHSMPAGIRPRATPSAQPRYQDDPLQRRAERSRYQDDPQQRRAPKPVKPKPVDVPERKAAKPRRTPAWLRTVLTLAFIGVLALGTLALVIMADMRTTEKARQQAWADLLSNYHVTQSDDGTLRVTWQDLIEHYAAIYNLNPAFVTAVIRNESSFRTTAVSSVGARGLMQMMPDTAEWIAGKLGESYDFDRLYDPETSIRYGCWYLGYLADLFAGDTVLVCAAYHAGQGEVWGWLGNTAISPDGATVPIANIPISNTRTYAERVTYAYGVYEKLLYPAEATAVPGAHSAPADFSAACR